MTPLLALLSLCATLAFAPAALAVQDHAQRPTGVPLTPLFDLQDQHNRSLSRNDLRNRPFLVIFGYTNCPEVCPTSLFEASQLLDTLGPDGERLEVLFVTVDPDRDTPDHLRTYLGSFHPRIRALTGSTHHINAVAAAFGAPIQKNGTSDDNYSMNHSSQIFFMDRYGLMARPVPYNRADALLSVARRLLMQ